MELKEQDNNHNYNHNLVHSSYNNHCIPFPRIQLLLSVSLKSYTNCLSIFPFLVYHNGCHCSHRCSQP